MASPYIEAGRQPVTPTTQQLTDLLVLVNNSSLSSVILTRGSILDTEQRALGLSRDGGPGDWTNQLTRNINYVLNNPDTTDPEIVNAMLGLLPRYQTLLRAKIQQELARQAVEAHNLEIDALQVDAAATPRVVPVLAETDPASVAPDSDAITEVALTPDGYSLHGYALAYDMATPLEAPVPTIPESLPAEHQPAATPQPAEPRIVPVYADPTPLPEPVNPTTTPVPANEHPIDPVAEQAPRELHPALVDLHRASDEIRATLEQLNGDTDATIVFTAYLKRNYPDLDLTTLFNSFRPGGDYWRDFVLDESVFQDLQAILYTLNNNHLLSQEYSPLSDNTETDIRYRSVLDYYLDPAMEIVERIFSDRASAKDNASMDVFNFLTRQFGIDSRLAAAIQRQAVLDRIRSLRDDQYNITSPHGRGILQTLGMYTTVPELMEYVGKNDPDLIRRFLRMRHTPARRTAPTGTSTDYQAVHERYFAGNMYNPTQPQAI